MWTSCCGHGRCVGERPHQAVGEDSRRCREALEGDRPGDRSVVEEQGDRPPRGQVELRRRSWDRSAAADIVPVFAPISRTCAAWWGARIVNWMPSLGQDLERLDVDRGLREPHPLRLAARSGARNRGSPRDLRDLVARVGQRQDHVVVGLGEGRAVPENALRLSRSASRMALVDLGGIALHPGQERRAEVEADLGSSC